MSFVWKFCIHFNPQNWSNLHGLKRVKRNHRASSRLCIWDEEIKSKTSRKIYMKTKYEIFLQWKTKVFLQKVLFLLHFGSCQNCMSSANLVVEIHRILCNKRALSTIEPCTCECVTLLQSFYRSTLSIHWCIAQNI